MLLARAGLDVLVVDAARPGAEPVSTLMIQPRGVRRLRAWGLDSLVGDLGAPPLRRLEHHVGDVTVAGSITEEDGTPALAPRRSRLDEGLLAAAAEAGATVRRRARVREVLREDGRATGVVLDEGEAGTSVHTCDLVVGADGVRSTVAEGVGADLVTDGGSLTSAHYAFLPTRADTVLLHETDGVLVTHIPTSDGSAVVAVYRRNDDPALDGDARETYARTVAAVPALADALDRPPLPDALGGFSGVRRQRNHFRDAAGPGWVLVGDAAHNRDSVTALGITQAFEQAEGVAGLVEHRLGSPGLDEALRTWWAQERDRLAPAYRTTLAFAGLEVTESRRALLCRVRDRGAGDEYVRAIGSGDLSTVLEALDVAVH